MNDIDHPPFGNLSRATPKVIDSRTNKNRVSDWKTHHASRPARFHDGNRAEHKEASMRDRKALKAITNAIMKAHVGDPARQHVMDKAKAEQFAKAALKGLHKAGFVVMKRGVMGA
jgi:hypothetical protein